MWKIRKKLCLLGAFLLALQGLPFAGLGSAPAKAVTYKTPALQDVMSRPRPIVIGNQWHITDSGEIGIGNTATKVDFAGKYLDYVVFNRDSGSPNDLFLDFTRSTRDPNRAGLKFKNDVYAAAAKYGRRVYVMPYHNMTDVFNFQSVKSQPNDCWMKPDGENIATWDYMDKHNYWLRKSDGSITSYPGYNNSQRRFWDSRRTEVQDYWAKHAKGITDQGFDGIFADNWLRSQIDHPDASNVQKGYNTIGAKYKQLAPDKILIGNSPPSSVYTTRDVLMLEDRIAPAFSGDKSVPQYLAYSDQAAAMNQACQDTYRDEASGDFKTFRLPLNLLTDNMLGVSTVTARGVALENDAMPYLLKLGKVGYPKGARYRANGILQRDFTEGKVLFNDTSSSATVTLPSGVYTTVDGNAVTTVTLGSLKGIVLKSKGSTPPPPVTTAPAAPSEMTVASVVKGATSGKYFINLTWKDNSNNETGFELYQSLNASDFQLIKTPAANGTSYGIDLGTTPVAGTYSYKILAVNDSGKSDFSNTAKATIGEPTPPPPPPVPVAPSDLTVTNVVKGATSGKYFVNLTWKDNSNDETGFELYQSFNSGNFELIKTPAADGTSYGIDLGTSPVPGTYSYKILAVNANGKSADSNVVTATISAPIPLPVAPTNLTGSSLTGLNGNKIVLLNLTDNSTNETGFNLYVSNTETGSFTKMGSVPANQNVIVIDLGTSSGVYYYLVKAFNEGGESGNSNVFAVTVN